MIEALNVQGTKQKEIIMKDLSQSRCEPCRTGAPKLTENQISELLKFVANWKIINENGVDKLTRVFDTKNYNATIKLVNEIARNAIEQDHHPVLLVEFDKVTVWWWTHKIDGLHKNDFIMATLTNKIYEEVS